MLHSGNETRRGWTWRIVALSLVAVALLGLLAACGGDDDPTPTQRASTGDTGDTGDTGGTTVAFEDKEFEFTYPSLRFMAWHSVTLKRTVEDQYPNITINLADVALNEQLADMARRPGERETAMHMSTETRWQLYDDGELWSLGAAQEYDPGQRAQAIWGVYPYSQKMILTYAETGISSVFDLDGKRVRLGADPTSESAVLYQQNFEIAGVKPRIIITTEQGPTGMIEGSFDASSSGVVFQLTTSGDYIPFQTTQTLRFIDFDLSTIEQMQSDHPTWAFLEPVPLCNSALKAAMNLDYDVIDPDYEGTMSFGGENCIASWGGHCACMFIFGGDEEAVYAMTRAQIDQAGEFALTYPGAPWVGPLWNERMGHSSDLQADYHPGAARAYEEAGLLYGQEGSVEWYSERTDPDRWWLDFIPQ